MSVDEHREGPHESEGTSGSRDRPGPDLVSSESAAATERLAAKLADRLSAGDVVAVSGEVGAGKSTFIRGACRRLGVTEPVTSPTFTIGRLYRGRDRSGEPLPIAHLDLYRLSDLDDEDPALLEDYLGADRLAFIEWPDAPAGRDIGADPTHRVTISHAGGDRRRVSVSG